MKRVATLLFALLMMTTVNAQTLTERQKGLAACACLMAQGNLERLEPVVRHELGTKNQTQLSGSPFDYTFCPQDDYYLKAHLFGDIFAGDQLTNADREIVTVAALSGLEGVAPQLTAHKKGAVNMGNPQELVDELCAWLDKEGYTLKSKWPKGEPNTGYAQYFIGNSYLSNVGGDVHNVTFEPRCRNNWHIHHKQVQVLICVAGRGWYQEWGKEPVEMTTGTVQPKTHGSSI